MSPAESGGASSSNTENPESTPLHFVRCAHIGYLQIEACFRFDRLGRYRSTDPSHGACRLGRAGYTTRMNEPRLIQIGQTSSPALGSDRVGRPEWLRIKLATSSTYHQVRNLVSRLDLHTVCQEARCPNIYECWGEHGPATFMILGDVCTRRCGFCAVTSGRPQPGVDPREPDHVAEAVTAMGLRHAVITSVDRDDLPDGGAGHFAQVIEAIHRRAPGTRVRGVY